MNIGWVLALGNLLPRLRNLDRSDSIDAVFQFVVREQCAFSQQRSGGDERPV